jgi:two-component system, LytTR family, sensor kinase
LTTYPRQTNFLSIHFCLSGFWWWLHYTIYGWVYWYYFKSLETERKLRQTETAKLQAEINHLKAQINPHFLYNTLNWFYDASRYSNPPVAAGIVKLSQIMRYSLKESNGGLAPLADEWAQVENYIALHQLRYDGSLQITVTQQGPLENRQLPPHVLITLVENAFKHGEIKAPQNFMNIELHTGSEALRFLITNKIGKAHAFEQSGRGLPNIAKRLAHEYKGTAVFEYAERQGAYRVLLVLPATPQTALPPA